ncbi:hypothetical protein ACJJTC_000434 [Scirpophaga incertulas]
MGYIDLGSKCTLIRRSYAENIIAPEDWETDSLPILQGFGNSVVKPLGRIRTIIQIGMVRAETELLVVDDGYLHTPVLVGQSFTEKPNVILYKTKDELLFISMPDCEDQNIRVNIYTTTRLIIPPKTTVPIDVRVENNYTGDLFVPYSFRKIFDHEYAILTGLFRIVAGNGFILTSNLSNENIIMEEGTLLVRGRMYSEENKFNKSRKAPKQYQVGDLVRIEKDIRTESGHSRKLLPKCIGPYRISKVLGNDRYEIVDTPITRKNAVRAYKAVYAVDKMHPWLSFDNDVISSESE